MSKPADDVDAAGEVERVEAVRSTGLLDSPAAEEFDRITRLGAAILDASACFISLVDKDRDFYLSQHGFAEPLASERELRGPTFCHLVVSSGATVAIADTHADPAHRGIPTVESLGVAAYLGVPLVLPTGKLVGSFCAIDVTPRPWTDGQIAAAEDLASIVVSEMEARRLVKAELAQAARLQAFVNSTLDGMYDMDVEGNCAFINDAGAAMLGYTPAELRGRRIHDTIHYAYADGSLFPLAECPIRRCAQLGTGVHVDADVFWRKDGTPIRVDYSASPLIIAGRAEGAVVSFRDVTTKRILQEKLAASERKYRRLFLDLPVGLFQSTASGEFLDANPAFLEIFGVPDLNALKGRNAESLYADPEDHEHWKQEVGESGSVTDREVMLRRPSGDNVWVRLSIRGARNDDGEIVRYDGIVRDITSQKAAEAELAEVEAINRQILDAAPDAFVATDEHSRIIRWNDAAVHTFGWTAEEALGRTLPETIIPPQHREAHEAGVRRFADSGQSRMLGKRLEMTALHRNGREFPVELVITGIKHKRLLFTSFLRDITERRQLAEHLRQSQKMEALGGLAGGIAHDFNNLLTVIRINAEWLGDGLPAEKRPDLDEVLKAADRATALTQQLLAYSRKQFLDSEPTNLNGVVSSIEVMLRRLIPTNLDIVVDLAPSLKTVNVDRGKIEQVITNLVINAKDAASDTGRILIETRPLHLLDQQAGGWGLNAGEYVLLSVTDDGQGMPDEVRERAFEPFFTTKPEGSGTGLGLSMVYGIVKQSGGDIRLISAPNEGTTVQMLFPVVADAVEPASESQPGDIRTGSETILVVEDQPSLRRVAKRILVAAGYTVLEAGDGEDALRQFDGLKGGVDLVLSDLVMPRMGGRELVRRLREQVPNLKVMYMSGYSSDAAGRSSTQAGPELPNLLQKPFSRDDLLRAVRRSIDEG